MALSPSVTPRLTREVLTELHDAGAGALSLSLDGAQAATHDAFRGVPGVFDATLRAAQEVRDTGFRLQINSTVTRANVHELPDLLRMVIDLGASLWSVFFLVPTGRGELLQPLEPQQVEDVLNWLHDVSDLTAIKTTEAPHYRRVAIQRARARVEGAASRAPAVGELHQQLTDAVAELRAQRHTETRRPRPPIEVNPAGGSRSSTTGRGLPQWLPAPPVRQRQGRGLPRALPHEPVAALAAGPRAVPRQVRRVRVPRRAAGAGPTRMP